ncbi:MAG TPA: hypothetical protein VGL56_16785 [Fimbriimonadaceae bacterium]
MNDNSIKCLSCGAMNPAGSRVCTLCNTPLGPAQGIPPTQEGQYYRPPSAAQVGNWWDKQAAPYKKGSAWLWFHVFCCQVPGLIVAVLLIACCSTQEGKDNGMRLLKYSAIGFGVAVVIRIVLIGLALAPHR